MIQRRLTRDRTNNGMNSRPPHQQDVPEQLARRLPDSAVAVGRTAAVLHGLDVPPPGQASATWPVELSVPRDYAGVVPTSGVQIYRWSIPPEDITTLAGLSVSTLERTAWDCARCLPRMEAIAALDQFVRAGVAPGVLLQRASDDIRYGRRVASVLDMVDPLAQSPGESWNRCLIVDSGLPRPRSQLPVDLAGGRAHLDLAYEEYRQGIEYYGEDYHGDLQRRHDAARIAGLCGRGWGVLVVRANDVLVNPDMLLSNLFGRLRRRGWSPAPSHAKKVRKRIAYICVMMRREGEGRS